MPAFSVSELDAFFDRALKKDLHFHRRLDPILARLYEYYFRCEVVGMTEIPNEKVLFVGNHNGLVTYEVLMLYYAWRQTYGFSRDAVALAHDFVFKNKTFAWFMGHLGAVPAHPQVALEAFDRGHSVLVFPGGEKEAFRPYSQRKQVHFFERKGFIRLALTAGVKIVPIVSVGAHESFLILNRGEKVSDFLGLKKSLRLQACPITLRSLMFLASLMSGVFSVFAPALFASIFVPLPAKMRFRVLSPIDPMAILDPNLSEAENWAKIYDQVLGSMQLAMDEEYSKRQYPILG